MGQKGTEAWLVYLPFPTKIESYLKHAPELLSGFH